MTYFKRVLFIMCICVLTGCQKEGVVIEDELAEVVVSEPIEPMTFDYEVPTLLPNILIDQEGYEATEKKMAYFRGTTNSGTFYIMDKETNSVVYTGEMDAPVYNPIFQESLSVGDFSDFDQEGNFYIMTSYLGRSYDFTIKSGLYESLFYNALLTILDKKTEVDEVTTQETTAEYIPGSYDAATEEKPEEIHELSGGWINDLDQGKDVTSACDTISNLLVAYELFPEEFTDRQFSTDLSNDIPDLLDEVRFEIDFLLKMQDTQSGGVFEGVMEKENGDLILEPIQLQATMEFVAITSKFAYSYKEYDKNYASKCLTAAEKAWKYILTQEEDKDLASLKGYAAAELYRSLGGAKYRAYILSAIEDSLIASTFNEYQLYSSLSYLTTSYRVDTTLCAQQIKEIMDEVDTIFSDSRTGGYGISSSYGNGAEGVLESAKRLTVADSIIKNHEYLLLMENQLHYLLGANPKGLSYIEGQGSALASEEELISKSSEKNSEFILILAGILNSLGEEDTEE